MMHWTGGRVDVSRWDPTCGCGCRESGDQKIGKSVPLLLLPSQDGKQQRDFIREQRLVLEPRNLHAWTLEYEGRNEKDNFHMVLRLSHNLSALDTWWLFRVPQPTSGAGPRMLNCLSRPPVNLSLAKTEPREERVQDTTIISFLRMSPDVLV